jgi:hypothetical protein
MTLAQENLNVGTNPHTIVLWVGIRGKDSEENIVIIINRNFH